MDVRNSLKFMISSGDVYCQCNLESHKKNMEKRRKKRLEVERSMIDKNKADHREGEALSHPP
jgi:hypothetical protein